MANAWDALLQPARPISTGPNPDYDQAMGINTNTGNDLQDALGQLQSIQQRNTPVGQAMTMEIAKEKMANQLALQLMQQKMQLQRQYPEYQSHPTPWGSVLMVNPYDPSDNKEVGGFEGAKDTYIAQEKAKAADANADAVIKGDPSYASNQLAESKAKLGLIQAQTGEANAMASLRPAQALLYGARTDAAAQKDTELSETDKTKIQQRVMAKYGYNPLRPFGIDDDQKAAMLAEITSETQKEAAAKAAGSPRSAGLAAPAAQATPPDLSGLMQPLSD